MANQLLMMRFSLAVASWGIFYLLRERSNRHGQELDDILALDYLPPNSTYTWDLPIWTNEWREAMNKQMAHISCKRDKEWNHEVWVPKLQVEFCKPWLDFIDAVEDPDYRSEFHNQLEERQKTVGF